MLVSRYAVSGIHHMAVYTMKPRTLIGPDLHCLVLLKLRISSLVLRRIYSCCYMLRVLSLACSIPRLGLGGIDPGHDPFIIFGVFNG